MFLVWILMLSYHVLKSSCVDNFSNHFHLLNPITHSNNQDFTCLFLNDLDEDFCGSWWAQGSNSCYQLSTVSVRVACSGGCDFPKLQHWVSLGFCLPSLGAPSCSVMLRSIPCRTSGCPRTTVSILLKLFCCIKKFKHGILELPFMDEPFRVYWV